MREDRPAPSERILRRIETLLDAADQAIADQNWALVRQHAQAALAFDPDNVDARGYLAAAQRAEAGDWGSGAGGTGAVLPQPPQPSSFCDGRYEVKRFLGEGGKKRVFLAYDSLLDRDVAFALIKTEGLDDVGRERVRREAQAMGRLGAHPHIVSVFDLGETPSTGSGPSPSATSEQAAQPFIVTELMEGGDVEGLVEHADSHRVPLADALRIADEVCRGLEFAHAKGIVHRDLKPGNVWLSADGTAKIGDFGLAVAVDRARLTQAGLMVGTVSYMPPEQATGGEVTPRSDLYSLGAMLYELVTGRPPFVGDESVAIITQHLNTPPVAPSWHVAELPPGLEALILRLLEKDPGRRPASAAEVRKMLADAALTPRPPLPTLGEGGPRAIVGPSPNVGGGVGVGAVSPNPQSPLYRRTFVGRERELHQLQAAFDEALSGQGSLAMVVGEPGIGKTSICEQLTTYVAMRGGKTLVGHCYEEGSLSIPYLPFVEAMRSYVLARDPDDLRKDLGSGAADVARLVSEIRDKLALSPNPSPNVGGGAGVGATAEDERWRLLQAVGAFLRNASSVQPLLIVLEDLHDADRGSLDLLLHLSRNLIGARFLIAGTYRDVEVDRSHPLSSALAELRRAASFLRVPLRGLTVDEVQRMMSIVRGQDVPWSRAEAIHRQTEGNPLFVQEVLRYLVEEGFVVRDGGRYALTEEGADAGIPEGLRDVVGKRLSRLSERANQVLSVASVIGRDFALEVLLRVVGPSTGTGQGLSEDEVIEALEEAQERAVIEERSAGGLLAFRFTHAFFRQTLYEEIFAARRIRWHQQVARALEAVHARRLEEHAAELAEHFAHSSDPADLQKAVEYAELAARRALSVYAYGEAARHWGQALKAQDVLDPDDKTKRCDLLLAQGEAMLPLEEPGRIASSVAAQAFGLAEALGDSPRAARAAVIALEALVRATGDFGPIWQSADAQEWLARADRYAVVGTADRVYADVRLGMGRQASGGAAAGHPFLRRAIERARELEGHPAFFLAAAYGRYLLALRDRETVHLLADEFLRRPRQGARSGDLGLCLRFVGGVLLERGDREGAERAWRELGELAERTRDATLTVLAIGPQLDLAVLDGRLEDALAASEAIETRAEELRVSRGSTEYFYARALIYLGRTSEALSRFDDASSRAWQAIRAMCLAHVGRHQEARTIREHFGDIGSDEDPSGVHVLTMLFEAAVLGDDQDTARALARRLAPLAQYPCATPLAVSYARLLGAAAALLGEREQAKAYYQQALEVCALIRFRPEIALTHLQLAELLIEYYPAERPQAQGHLDFAIEEFRAMKMQPSLERALRHKGLLQA